MSTVEPLKNTMKICYMHQINFFLYIVFVKKNVHLKSQSGLRLKKQMYFILFIARLVKKRGLIFVVKGIFKMLFI